MARVTQLGQVNQSLAALQNSLSLAQKYQNQAASNKRITVASDDPHGAAISIQLRAQQAANAQYGEGASYATAQLATTDSTLQAINSQLTQVRNLVITSQGATTTQSRSSLAAQVSQAKDTLIALYNTQYQGRSIFGGTSATGAIDADGNYTGDGNAVMVRLSASSTVRLDVDGTSIGADKIAGLMDQLASDVASGAPQIDLSDLDDVLNQVTTANGGIGAIESRVSTAQTALDSQNNDLAVSLSQNEDVDYADVLTKFSSQQVAYQAALGITAKINQTSLLDFLQ